MVSERRVSWSDRKALRPAEYVWKGELVSCERWALESADGRRVCEMEVNGRGYTVDYLIYDENGYGTILSFTSAVPFDLCFRRIYQKADNEVIQDILRWVNDWKSPQAGIDGGFVLALDAWGNEIAV